MMNIDFRDKYVDYNEICDVTLLQIHDVLLKDDNISLELGDDASNWAGYLYYLCKQHNKLDDKAIASFVNVITWIMTGVNVDIFDNFESDKYYKNDKILVECSKIYYKLVNENESVIDLCKKLVNETYNWYEKNHEDFIRKTERISCILSYKEMELFNKIEGESYGDKLVYLLNHLTV